MTKSCEHGVEGILGTYCPLLLGQSEIPPFCDGSESHPGKACYTWDLAQRSAGKVLPKPNISSVSSLHCQPLFGIDFILEKQQILCVEDNPVSMKVITKSLTPLKRDILKAKNGQEALDILQTSSDVKLILLDLDMPVMDGYQFVDTLCEIHDGNLPYAIILVSELSVWEKAKGLIEKGVISYIKKPYTSENLLSVIYDGLNQHRCEEASKR